MSGNFMGVMESPVFMKNKITLFKEQVFDVILAYNIFLFLLSVFEECIC